MDLVYSTLMEESQLLRELVAPPCQRVIVALADGKPCARAELASRSGLSAPALSRALPRLAQLGLIEVRPLDSSGGRPPQTYRLRVEPLCRLLAAVRQFRRELTSDS